MCQGSLELHVLSHVVLGPLSDVTHLTGCPPTHAVIRFIASRILANDNDPKPLGRNWMEGFLRRNPSVKSIESARLANANAEIIQDFF